MRSDAGRCRRSTTTFARTCSCRPPHWRPRAGITAVHEMSMPHWHGEQDLAVFLRHRARLPVDAMPIVASTDLAAAIDRGLGSIGGDLPVDGSIGARTAWISGTYDEGGAGSSYHSDDELAEFFHGGHAAGLQVGVHAIGDRAIDQVLSAWERVYHALDSRERRHFRARRHRIEHFELVSTAHVERAAMLGLSASVQPAFDATWGGRRRALRATARPRPSRGDEPVPHDARARRGGGGRVRRAHHAPRSDARHHRARDAPRPFAAPHAGRGDPAATRSGLRASAIRRTRRASSRRACTPTSRPSRRTRSRSRRSRDLRPVLTASLGREVFVG